MARFPSREAEVAVMIHYAENTVKDDDVKLMVS
jgi:hypothetical protein